MSFRPERSAVEESRGTTIRTAAGFLDFARNDMLVRPQVSATL
ncbi:MAG: hypothetical protein AVDCRST_MAG42-1471 [uncultured Chthoniobacterales bacterium]|uniref:Uncharacterized protein n=1 Tax=uncultured Chthoniobacterales bacterium TaxID=1836801 RepID=A0A6J4I0H6_9BACT|nr:MAG: hypothetical protein AVDCRST_MAG42-1471 [uncultured Chthoniobacterales bacterium]